MVDTEKIVACLIRENGRRIWLKIPSHIIGKPENDIVEVVV
jgi:hypothetical protein